MSLEIQDVNMQRTSATEDTVRLGAPEAPRMFPWHPVAAPEHPQGRVPEA